MQKKLVVLSTLVTLAAIAMLVRDRWPQGATAIRGEVVETYCFTTANESGAAMGKQVTVQGDVIKRGSSTFLTVKTLAVE